MHLIALTVRVGANRSTKVDCTATGANWAWTAHSSQGRRMAARRRSLGGSVLREPNSCKSKMIDSSRDTNPLQILCRVGYRAAGYRWVVGKQYQPTSPDHALQGGLVRTATTTGLAVR